MYYAIDRKPPVADHALESYGIVPSHAIFSARETKKMTRETLGERNARLVHFFFSRPLQFPPVTWLQADCRFDKLSGVVRDGFRRY